MSERHLTRVTVLNKSVYGSIADEENFSDDTVIAAIAWLQEQLAAIPEKYRSSACLEIKSIGGWEGEHHSELTIYYDCPESDDERAVRRARELSRAEESEELAARHLAEAADRRRRLLAEGS